MAQASDRPSRRQRAITWLAIAAALTTGLVIDAIIPAMYVVTPVYAVAVLIATWRLSVSDVLLTSILALVADLYSSLTLGTPIPFTILYTSVLLLICALAIIVSRQKRHIGELLAEQVTLYRDSERQRAKGEAILRYAPSGILFVDALTGAITANPALDALLGRSTVSGASREQYQGVLRHVDESPVPLDALPSSIALRTHQTVRKELLILQPSGRVIQIAEVAAPVRDSRGEVIGVIAVLQDVTAFKDLDRIRQEWTSIIAHDLRQPTTVIIGYAGLIERKAATTDPSLVRPAEQIHHAASHLDRMISDLLDVTRIETRRLALKKQEVDLPALTHAIVEREGVVTRGHPISITVSGSIPPVEADPLRIEQVIGNLLSNAVKYGYADTPIRIELTRRGECIETSVINEGEGIPPSELPALFNRFYRTQEARQGKVAGLGLGLYIVKGLVEAHHGHAWAESTPGKTTSFHFTLPITPPR